MKKGKTIIILIFILSFVMISCCNYVNKVKTYKMVSGIMGAIDEESSKMAMLQLNNGNPEHIVNGKKILSSHGYHLEDMLRESIFENLGISIGFSAFVGLILYGFFRFHKKKMQKRLNELENMIKNMERGHYAILFHDEDIFSSLEDSLYKAMLLLRETKENAVNDRNQFKESLENIAHQLKTPITSIGLLLELYYDETNTIERENILKRIKKNIDKLKIFTDTLLTLSKLDTGNIIMKKEKFFLSEMVENAWEQLQDNRREKPVKLDVNGDLFIKGDFYWLTEAVINILENAMNCYPDVTKINVTGSKNPIFTEIIIEDNGKGFPDRELPLLFERFKRLDPKKNEGFGIGLTLAKSIIEQNNGEITAKNKNEGGLLFSIKFYPITNLSY